MIPVDLKHDLPPVRRPVGFDSISIVEIGDLMEIVTVWSHSVDLNVYGNP
jgi:hypothetical protein